MKTFYLFFSIISLILFSLSCDDKSTSPGEDENTCQEPPAYNMQGEWQMQVVVKGGNQLPAGTSFTAWVDFQQSEDGTITGTSLTEGGLTGSFTGKVCGTHVQFQLTQNGCSGTFTGSGEIGDGKYFLGSYGGSDCNGTLEGDVYACIYVPPVVINNDTTWQGKVKVFSSVTVTPSATLTIEPGTEIDVYKYDLSSIFRIPSSIKIEGTLIAKGTTTNPILFYNSLANTPGSWSGIDLKGSNETEIEYCIFRNANPAIRTSVSVKNISNCLIDSCFVGIKSLGENKTISKVSIKDALIAYDCHGNNHSDTLSSCYFGGNFVEVDFMGSSNSVFITGSNFTDVSAKPFDFYTTATNCSVSLNGCYGIAAVDTVKGTNHILVTDVVSDSIPGAGCGF